MSAITDRANALRARLHDDFHHGTYPGAPYYLRNIKSNKITDTTITGHAQSVHCRFCGRQFGTLPQLAKSKRGHNASTRIHSNTLYAVLDLHLESCAFEWLRATLARWSTGQMSADEQANVYAWQQKHMQAVKDNDGRYDRMERIPKELASIWSWADTHHENGTVERVNIRLPGIFDSLPQPPGSDMAQNLEVALIAISRMWTPKEWA